MEKGTPTEKPATATPPRLQLTPEEIEDRNRKANQRVQALLSGKARAQDQMTEFCVGELRKLHAEQDGARNNQEVLEQQLEQTRNRRKQLAGEISASLRTLAYADPVLRAFDPQYSAGHTEAVSESKEQPSDNKQSKPTK